MNCRLLLLITASFTLFSGRMLKDRMQGSPSVALQKIPRLARQLELALYRDAPSIEAYSDMNSLQQRLQNLSVEYCWMNRRQGSLSQYTRRGEHLDQRQQASAVHCCSEPRSPPNTRDTSHQSKRRRQTDSTTASTGGMQGSRSSSISDIFAAHNLLQKQQRLLLLQHSANCPNKDGHCPVTKYCAQLKRLWEHMEGCADNKCQMRHCFSSRVLLTHYNRCQDPRCHACGPVRQVVRNDRYSNQTSSAAAASSVR